MTAHEELVQKIVMERIKAMDPHVKIALGSQRGFLTKDELLQEVKKGTPTGKKIMAIQMRYLQALKEGWRFAQKREERIDTAYGLTTLWHNLFWVGA